MNFQTLSIRQPYAWLIAAGIKGFENRQRVFARTGLFWIHASKFDTDLEATIQRLELQYDIMIPRHLAFGAIIGLGSIIRAVYEHDPLPHAWRIGRSGGYLLDNSAARVLETPQPQRGQLGWFNAEVREDRFRTANFRAWSKAI